MVAARNAWWSGQAAAAEAGGSLRQTNMLF